MKGILVTTDNTAEIRDFEAPLYKTIGEAVGGYIEIVHPMGLADPLVMVVNEEGLRAAGGQDLHPVVYITHRYHPLASREPQDRGPAIPSEERACSA